MKTKTSELFMLIAERCGREHGKPLPKGVLEISDGDWLVKLDVDRLRAYVSWGGSPMGIIEPSGGCVVPGAEDALCEWLSGEKESQ